MAKVNPVDWAVTAGREAVARNPDWGLRSAARAPARPSRRLCTWFASGPWAAPAPSVGGRGPGAARRCRTASAPHVRQGPGRQPGGDRGARMRALDELGIASVAVYSEADRDALHVRRAGEAYLLGPGPAAGVLSGRRQAARGDRAVRRRGGAPRLRLPRRERRVRARARGGGHRVHRPARPAIEAMGSKTRARELMQAAGVPIVPGTTEPVETVDDARARRGDRLSGRGQGRGRRRRQGLPRRARAATARGRLRGRGARGREVLLRPDRLPRALPARPAPRRGAGAGRRARQRHPPRRARLLDPAPPPEADRGVARARSSTTRCASGSARSRPRPRARSATRRGNDRGPAPDGEYFFLEMNTRVQVEHCVTEATTGHRHRPRADPRSPPASRCRSRRSEVVLRGHAIECRINAEDAAKNFAPAPGTITAYREPAGPGVRVDSGVVAGSEIPPLYDPMVAKLIVWDVDREQATRRMARALDEFEIEGVRTLIPFHRAIMASEQWARGETCRDLVEDREWLKTLAVRAGRPPRTRSAETVERTYTVEVSGKRFDVRVLGDAAAGGAQRRRPAAVARPAPRARAPRRRRGAAATRSPRRSRATCSRSSSSRAPPSRRARCLHRRGDEDGERDHRAQGGRDRRAADRRGRRRVGRRHHRGDHRAGLEAGAGGVSGAFS